VNERSIHQPQLPNGHTSILSPAFQYVPAVKTDLSTTFARIRAQRPAQARTGGGAQAIGAGRAEATPG
jgi:hypothetical protein